MYRTHNKTAFLINGAEVEEIIEHVWTRTYSLWSRIRLRIEIHKRVTATLRSSESARSHRYPSAKNNMFLSARPGMDPKEVATLTAHPDDKRQFILLEHPGRFFLVCRELARAASVVLKGAGAVGGGREQAPRAEYVGLMIKHTSEAGRPAACPLGALCRHNHPALTPRGLALAPCTRVACGGEEKGCEQTAHAFAAQLTCTMNPSLKIHSASAIGVL